MDRVSTSWNQRLIQTECLNTFPIWRGRGFVLLKLSLTKVVLPVVNIRANGLCLSCPQPTPQYLNLNLQEALQSQMFLSLPVNWIVKVQDTSELNHETLHLDG